MIIPITFIEATTVLAHMVFSKFRASLFKPSSVWHVITPSKLYISLEGGSHSAVESFTKNWYSSICCVIPGAFLNFQSVSPSSWSVLIKAWLSFDSLKVFRTIISAGTLQFFFNWIISPTNKSDADFSSILKFFLSGVGTNTSTLVEFVFLSWILLLISS